MEEFSSSQKARGFLLYGLLTPSFVVGCISLGISTVLTHFFGMSPLKFCGIIAGLFLIGASLIRGYFGYLYPAANPDDSLYFESKDSCPPTYALLYDRDGEVVTVRREWLWLKKLFFSLGWGLITLSVLSGIAVYMMGVGGNADDDYAKPPYAAPYFADFQWDSGRYKAEVMEPVYPIPGSNIGLLRVKSEAANRIWGVVVGLPCDLQVGDEVMMHTVDYLNWGYADGNNEGTMSTAGLRVLELPPGSPCTFSGQ